MPRRPNRCHIDLVHAHNRVPQLIGLGLVVRRDLEQKRLAVLEGRAAIQPQARDAQHRELHRQHVALLACVLVAGRLHNPPHGAVGKGGRVERRRLQRRAVEPEAEGGFGGHGVLLLRVGGYSG